MTYSYDSVDVQPLLTLSPEVTPTVCALPNDLRLYRLSIVNANTQPYLQITATVALPLGVRFNRVVSGTTAPQISIDGSGVQTLKWTDLAVNAKPSGQYAAQVDLWVELKIGQALGSLDIVAQASSFDTLIPRRDGVQDPSILMCALTNATLAKNVSQSQVVSGTIVTYELLLANPGNGGIVADVEDVLPVGATFVAGLNGYTPQINGQTLTWSSIVVPAATTNLMGTAARTYQVRLSGLNVTQTNTARVTNSSVTFNPSQTQASVYVQAPGSTISGTVYVDFNMNGTRDSEDLSLGNISVVLRTSTGALSTSLTQVGLGTYVFTDVAEGPYTLTVNTPSVLLNTTPAMLTGVIGIAENIVTVFGLASAPSLNLGGVSVAEGASGSTAASLSLTMTRAVSVPVSVRYTTVDTNTAKQGTDFVYASAVVTIPAGSTATTVPISINGDSQYEGDEVFYVTLSGPVNGRLGTAKQAAVTILNDDTPPSIAISPISTAEGAAGSKVMNFTISLSALSGITTSVTVSTVGVTASGSDFVPLLMTVDIPPGAQSGTVGVTINGDTLYELDETFSVVLSNPVNGTIGQASATGTIQNDDGMPTLGIGDAGVTEGNAGSRTAVFTLTLSAVAGVPITVSYSTVDATATAPGDYTAASSTAVIASGALTTQITITTRGDLIFEPDETFVVNLSAPVNATLSDGQGVGTIRNDDKQPTTPALAISDATISETHRGTTSMIFTVTLSSASSSVVSVTYATLNGTAVAPTDFVATSGLLVIPANALSRTIVVTVNGDTVVENDETFTVELSNSFNATIANTQATGTIKNDDLAGGGGTPPSYKMFMPMARK